MKKQKTLYGYALVTGATGGLGKAFVYTLAQKGYKLLLTGRSQEKLSALQDELCNTFPRVETHIYPADLSDADSRTAMADAIKKDGFTIGLLVNAAGADIQKGVSAYTQEKIAFQCRVNFEAAVSLCKFALEYRAEELEIINVSSVSGIYPMPYFAIYSATKGALTSFSQALREEVKKDKVRVTAILPGAMPTRADIKEQIKGQGLWGKLAVKSPEWVAEYSLKAVAKNKAKTIPGFWNKVMRISTAWMPVSWKLKFIAKRWSKISKDAF
ncbi:MAG: SDR family NAD(P)-dependent oxidoreductase [Clostridia bacterium]|nr:SDR family NAD(P)-dependent oxidoreductase [Clostridia bacterium]